MPAPRAQRATSETSPQIVRLPPVLPPTCSPWLNPLSVDYLEYPYESAADLPYGIKAWQRAAASALAQDAGDVFAGGDDQGQESD